MSGLERIDYADGATALTGWLARPVGAARGALLVFPMIVGITPLMERRARMLAEAGFIALIADFHGEPVTDFAASFPLAAALRGNVDGYRTRLSAALAALRAVAGVGDLPLGALGYCMGGQASLELARIGADIACAVSFHGELSTGRPAEPGVVSARILVCHGDADPLVPRAQVLGFWDEMERAGADWHFHAYAGVRHSFTDPDADSRGMDAVKYNASADRQSWAAMISLFDEIFGPARA